MSTSEAAAVPTRGGGRRWARIAMALGALLLMGPVSARSAFAFALEVKEVASPGGVKAWLARTPGSQLVAMHFAFMGGSTQDPVGKEGVAVLMSTLLAEGAGQLDGPAFKAAVGRAGLRLEFSVSRDAVFGAAEFRSADAPEALALLRLALMEPRFDEAAVARARARMAAENADAARNQRAIAHRRWHEHAFAGSSYARPAEGTEDSLPRVGRDDLVQYRRQVLSRGALRVVVTGDLTATELGDLLDKVFATLPVEIAMVPPRTLSPRPSSATIVVPGNFSQSLAVIGLPFLPPHDPDFPAALVLQRILGGDQLDARVLAALRVKHRLAYSASIDLAGDAYASLLKGEVVTVPERMDEAIKAALEALSILAERGPTEAEVEDAKNYLIGSFPLSFDSSGQISANLLALRLAGHGPDYLARRATALASVTPGDVHRIARRWLEPAAVSVVVVTPQAKHLERTPD